MPRGGHNIKPASERVNRRTKDTGGKVINMNAKKQPPLDESLIDWPQITRDWWAMWGRSPLARDHTEEDWRELADTAYIHALFYTLPPGSPAFFKASAQLRQRTANYGVTPLDRQRLRIQFVFAGEAEAKADEAAERRETRKSSRARRGPMVEETG